MWPEKLNRGANLKQRVLILLAEKKLSKEVDSRSTRSTSLSKSQSCSAFRGQSLSVWRDLYQKHSFKLSLACVQLTATIPDGISLRIIKLTWYCYNTYRWLLVCAKSQILQKRCNFWACNEAERASRLHLRADHSQDWTHWKVFKYLITP